MMNPSLRLQFERLEMRLSELDANLSDPQLLSDPTRWRRLSQEQAEVADVVGLWRRYRQREQDVASAREMLPDPEMAELAAAEIEQAGAEMAALQERLRLALVPRDPDDARNAFLEIRAGTGGDESALFAGDLARMYQRYCERHGLAYPALDDNGDLAEPLARPDRAAHPG